MEKVEAEQMRKISPDYFVNIGTGKDIKIKELAKLIREIVGYQGEITHDTTRPDGTPRKLLDVSKINELGWRYRIELNEGVLRVLNVIKKQKPFGIYLSGKEVAGKTNFLNEQIHTKGTSGSTGKGSEFNEF